MYCQNFCIWSIYVLMAALHFLYDRYSKPTKLSVLATYFSFTEIIFLLKTGKKLLMTLQYNVLTFWEIINDDDSFGEEK
jgi:hypothetical protein